MFLVIKVQVIAYWIASYYALRKHQKNIRLLFSSLEAVNLSWMNYFLLGLLFGVFIWFNQQIFRIELINEYSSLGYLLIIFALSYFVVKQGEVFHFQAAELNQIKEVINEPAISKAQRLSRLEVESMKLKLKLLMETEKPFLNPNLELPSLASKINLTPHELSYLLNNCMNCNFFEFVNQYRVEEAKNLLLSDKHKHLNILGIAYESGFNSKTTFNSTFKKLTGFTPSHFIKNSTASTAD
jgi:YesN/AraC family two-component response regulator